MYIYIYIYIYVSLKACRRGQDKRGCRRSVAIPPQFPAMNFDGKM